jgi:hypothetical protein
MRGPGSRTRCGHLRVAASEFVLACDMRFLPRESAIFSQPEPAFGLIPGRAAPNTSRALWAAPGRQSSQPIIPSRTVAADCDLCDPFRGIGLQSCNLRQILARLLTG